MLREADGEANCVAAVNWHDAQRRVLKSYREWIRSVRLPTSAGPSRCIWRELELYKWAEKSDGRSGHGRANDQWQAPEIQTMYSLNIPVPALRTKMRQEFERHRYVNQIQVVDTLLFQSHAEFQVRWFYFILDVWHRRTRGFAKTYQLRALIYGPAGKRSKGWMEDL